MKNYQVTWGVDTNVVTAENENDAWALFAQDHDLARKHPKLFERKLEEVAAKAAAPKPAAKPVKAHLAE
jgi:hypothetical protein